MQKHIVASINGSMSGVVLAVVGLIFSPQQALANVSLKNGNFFLGYTDIVYTGGFETRIERVYNSKTPFKGMFGWGWGNEYEASLVISVDGSIVVHEYGGGADNRFTPVNFSQQELDQAIDKLVATARKEGMLATPNQLADYKTRLKNDAIFRNDTWEKFRAQGKIAARELPNGTQLKSNRFSYQYITKSNDGFVRTFADTGRIEKFDNEGHLTRVSDRNANFLSFEYNGDKHVKKIMDNFNRKIFLNYNNHGLVTGLEGESGKKASYTYNDKDELISSKDVDGNSYTYTYDNNRHNMVKITYADQPPTTLEISYYGRDKQENVMTIKERDGTLSTYTYEKDPNKKDVLTVTVVSKKGNETVANSKYRYLTKIKPSGEEWTAQLDTDFDGEKVSTTYNEMGLPILIQQNGDKTTFQYDIKGHVTMKASKTEMTVLHYDPNANKVDSVTVYSMPGKKVTAQSDFKYDSKANLILAKDNHGHKVKLVYDQNGRIHAMVDEKQEEIDFDYNEQSKPYKITDPKLGSIVVTYTNAGDIKEVNSKDGQKIAMQVTAEFQGLLDIIRPAGVTLAF